MNNEGITNRNNRGLFVFIDRKRSLILLLIYITLLLGGCVFFRKPQEAVPRPGLFRSYRAAWYGSHLFPFAQNIILNILLYTPLGFLFCACIEKQTYIEISLLPKMHLNIQVIAVDGNPLMVLIVCMFFGFLVSLSIEELQRVFHRGIYETDDILNNTFGALLGASRLIMKYSLNMRSKIAWITYLFMILSSVLLLRVAWLLYVKL